MKKSGGKRMGIGGAVFLALLVVGCVMLGCRSGKPMYAELEGAWETDYIGDRVEITGDKITLLWMKKPVLETTFTLKEEGDSKVLQLEKSKYISYSEAIPIGLYLKENILYLEKDFPINGLQVAELSRTDNSRYGSGEIITEKVLTILEGEWVSDSGNTLIFKKDTVRYFISGNEHFQTKFVAISYEKWVTGGDFFLTNSNPATEGIYSGFDCLEYEDGVISGSMIVLDSHPSTEEFTKKK